MLIHSNQTSYFKVLTYLSIFLNTRRIAELKERECQIAVEDVMYLLIFYKFSEIRVHLVPRLSRCIYNGRLEIWPARDWALECIHNFEVLEMIKEHLTTVLGWKPKSNVTENWATTQIRRFQLGQIYAASILYGYFLKSASLRHHLEMSLVHTHHDLPSSNVSGFWSYGLKDLFLGPNCSSQPTSLGEASSRQEEKEEKKLRCYVMGFDPDTLQRCAKLKSKEAVNLVEKHSCALFGDEKTGLLETDDVISTSFSSMKRLVLEAVAFGSFLWDTEEYVGSVYNLKENWFRGKSVKFDNKCMCDDRVEVYFCIYKRSFLAFDSALQALDDFQP